MKSYLTLGIPFFISVLVLWVMLLPGYLLTLDMNFGPYFHIYSNSEGFTNMLPLWHLVRFFYIFLPAWVVEKLLLFILFFSLCLFSYTFLPVPNKVRIRLFASLIYSANTFVYIRMLAGQWALLFAYALLPIFIYLLIKSNAQKSNKSELQLGFVLGIMGIFSLHLFLLSCLISVVYFSITFVMFLAKDKLAEENIFSFKGLLAFVTTIVVTSYWTIPALIQKHSVLSQFTASHWEAFAATPHGIIPILLNLSMLGGFWGETHTWATFFLWPQLHVTFWIAFASVILLSLLGIYSLYRTRKDLLFLVPLGIVSLILATGVSATPFYSLNLFLYTHVPFWDGLRDSQKIIAFLALTYAVLAGYGFDTTVTFFEKRLPKIAPYITAFLFLIPITFGMYMWGGFAKQLPNVEYPTSWEHARQIIIADPSHKALVLPWQGYFSLAFDRNLIVANPGRQYFGPQAVISQNVRLDEVYDQSIDPNYSELDTAIQTNSAPNGQIMADYLKSKGITYVIYLQDLKDTDNFTYDFLGSAAFEPIYRSKELILYRIN